MNKLLMIAVVAALTGCSTFKDPSASKEEVAQCQKEGKAKMLSGVIFGYIGMMAAKKSAFEECMAARGYRTAQQ